MNIAVLGLSITSSWGNGHATTYRALLGALAKRGHRVHFLERDVPWYGANRDLPTSPLWQTVLYDSLDDLHLSAPLVRDAECVLIGSYVPEGPQVIDWVFEIATGVKGFYDIDTPVTLAGLADGTCAYLRPDQVCAFDLYLSFSGGPVPRRLGAEWGARLARPLYCAVDPDRYTPSGQAPQWDLGYLGTYSPDRQPALDLRLIEPARRWNHGRFVVAGPQFPAELAWPANVDHIEHLAPSAHPSFYGAQRFTLNVTRAAMVAAGHSPSVRLFEAAACGTPIISDTWAGLEDFFEPRAEILVTQSADETLNYLRELPEPERATLAARARARVLAQHTAACRAVEFEQHLKEAQQIVC
jgi:spore maturation protein CgeB